MSRAYELIAGALSANPQRAIESWPRLRGDTGHDVHRAGGRGGASRTMSSTSATLPSMR